MNFNILSARQPAVKSGFAKCKAIKITLIYCVDLQNYCYKENFPTAPWWFLIIYPFFHYFFLYWLECINNLHNHNIP